MVILILDLYFIISLLEIHYLRGIRVGERERECKGEGAWEEGTQRWLGLGKVIRERLEWRKWTKVGWGLCWGGSSAGWPWGLSLVVKDFTTKRSNRCISTQIEKKNAWGVCKKNYLIFNLNKINSIGGIFQSEWAKFLRGTRFLPQKQFFGSFWCNY